jgi:hypothetical protein
MRHMHWSRQDLDQCNAEDYYEIITMLQEEHAEAEKRNNQN